MADNHPVYCGNCGSLVQAGDRFCGVCGARVPEVAPPATPTEEIPTRVDPPETSSQASSRRRFPIPWWVLGGGVLAILVLGVGVVSVVASGGEKIEPLRGLSAEVPSGWVISPDSNQSGRIGNNGATILIPEEYRTSEDPVGAADSSIYLRKADTGECDSQPTQVESHPEAAEGSATLGGYDDFLTATGSMAHGESIVDGRAAPWDLRYFSGASPRVSTDGSTTSEYPVYSRISNLVVCVKDTDLIVDYVASPTMVENQPTADSNAAVPEAREETHQEVRQIYKEHFDAMSDFLRSIETGSWGGRTDLDNIPTTLDPHDDVLDDPFDGQLEDVAGSTPQPETTQAPTEAGETTSEPSNSERDQFEEFAYEYDEASRNEDWETTYDMLYETSQSGVTDSQDEFTEEEWIGIQQALRDENGEPAPLEGVTVDQNEEVTDSPARVTLYYEDGTQETITVIVPMAVSSGDETGPQRFLTEEEISYLDGLLVTGSTDGFSETTESGSTAPLGDDFVADAEEAAEEYYQAAGMEDWEYTYEHLDSRTQSLFTEEEWSQKNQYYWDLNPTIYDILSVDMVSDSQDIITEVRVRITGEEGSSFIRTTYWVLEDGEWLHRFSQEETDLFMPDLTYEEFVEANEGSSG